MSACTAPACSMLSCVLGCWHKMASACAACAASEDEPESSTLCRALGAPTRTSCSSTLLSCAATCAMAAHAHSATETLSSTPAHVRLV